MNLLLFSIKYRYLVTEGQITPLFLFTITFMILYLAYEKSANNSKLDSNG